MDGEFEHYIRAVKLKMTAFNEVTFWESERKFNFESDKIKMSLLETGAYFTLKNFFDEVAYIKILIERLDEMTRRKRKDDVFSATFKEKRTLTTEEWMALIEAERKKQNTSDNFADGTDDDFLEYIKRSPHPPIVYKPAPVIYSIADKIMQKSHTRQDLQVFTLFMAILADKLREQVKNYSDYNKEESERRHESQKRVEAQRYEQKKEELEKRKENEELEWETEV